tara:strand:+ start:1769 stop:2155 length:387 start_codon:yes stop_codon:yes gene_type:complete
MNIKFDHLSLSAENPEQMRDFLIELLGLKVGTRPNLNFDGYFLFAEEKDVIHIFGKSPRNDVNHFGQDEQNIVHHVSFYSDDYDDVMRRIKMLDVKYGMSQVPNTSVVQIFVRAPENLIIEIQAVPNQ